MANPYWRASAVGVYRLWRDLLCAVGALLAGVLADRFGVPWAIAGIALLTFVSGGISVALGQLAHAGQWVEREPDRIVRLPFIPFIPGLLGAAIFRWRHPRRLFRHDCQIRHRGPEHLLRILAAQIAVAAAIAPSG